jgi:hypothetical protein
MVEKSEELITVPSELVVQLTQELFRATIVVCPIGLAMIPLGTRDHLLQNLLKISKENGLNPIWEILDKDET